MKWRTAQHPWGTGRTMHTAGAFTITAWIDEGPHGGEFVRYDLEDSGYCRGSFRTLAAAKQHAASSMASVADADTRATLYGLGAEVTA